MGSNPTPGTNSSYRKQRSRSSLPFETDRSAARGEMSARQLILFKHASKLGNAPAHKLFDRVDIRQKHEAELSGQSADAPKPQDGAARCFGDYRVTLDETNLPEGITIDIRSCEHNRQRSVLIKVH